MLRIFACLGGLIIATSLCADQTGKRSAEQMMIDAHRVRAAWDKTFPGFTADVAVTVDNNVARGTLTVNGDGEVQLKLANGEHADWAKEQLASIVSHRFPSVRDQYDVAFADDELHHPLGRLISFKGNRHNFYRIRGNVITEVHRQFPAAKFIITVTDVSKNPEGKLLPRHFNVSYWNPKTNELVSNEDYQEDWIRVGGYDLPERRLMVKTAADLRTVREIRLSGHSLLDAKP